MASINLCFIQFYMLHIHLFFFILGIQHADLKMLLTRSLLHEYGLGYKAILKPGFTNIEAVTMWNNKVVNEEV